MLLFDSEWDFSEITSSKITHLYLEYSGIVSDWKSKPERFENLMKGIKSSKALSDSIKWIYVEQWKITKEYAEQVLKDLSLSTIKIHWNEDKNLKSDEIKPKRRNSMNIKSDPKNI